MLAFLSLLWGSSFLFIKIVTRAYDAYSFALGRVGIAALALALAAILTRLPWPRAPRLWARLFAMSALGQVGPFLLLGFAGKLTTSADLALTMAGIPIFTALTSRLLGLGEPGGARALFALAIGLTGVAVTLGSPVDAALYPQATLGRALGLIAAFGYSSGALMSKEASRVVGARMSATASMTLSAAMLALIWLFAAPAFKAAPTPGETAALITLGLFNTALAYFVYFRLVVLAGATFAALNNYIVPFIGLIMGAVLLGEPIALASWFGLALVILSVVLTGSASGGQREASSATDGSKREATPATGSAESLPLD